jgi:UDP-glucose 4-epimerase
MMTKNKVNFHQKWLLTGGCGFIGTSLIRQLVKNKNIKQIRILDDLSVGTKENLKNICDFKDYSQLQEEGIFLKVGNILDAEQCVDISRGVDCIVHLAANTGVPQSVKDPRKDMEVNVKGVFNMLEASRINDVKQFIFASSGAPAGEIDPPIHEEIAPHPVSPYGASKLAGEGYCSSYARTFGIKTVVLRFGNVYGPGSKYKSSVVAKFIKNVLAGIPCEIYGDGTQTRDFIFVHDLVNAIIKASQLDMGGEVFQIASGSELTVFELAETLKEILSEYDYDMKIKYADKRLGDVKRNYSNISKAKRLLNWNPKSTIIDGLKSTINWFITEK